MAGYLNFNDMIDGGGAGQSGSEFEGGGLLSLIANALASPLGSRQGRPETTGGLLSPQARPATPPPAVTPTVTAPAMRERNGAPYYPAAASPFAPMPPVQPQPMQYSGRGNFGMPSPPPLGFEEFVTGLGSLASSSPPDVLREAYRMHMSGYGQ